nr:uncharacterized protein LOC119167933 [Rhipicephalus microplus]
MVSALRLVTTARHYSSVEEVNFMYGSFKMMTMKKLALYWAILSISAPQTASINPVKMHKLCPTTMRCLYGLILTCFFCDGRMVKTYCVPTRVSCEYPWRPYCHLPMTVSCNATDTECACRCVSIAMVRRQG